MARRQDEVLAGLATVPKSAQIPASPDSDAAALGVDSRPDPSLFPSIGSEGEEVAGEDKDIDPVNIAKQFNEEDVMEWTNRINSALRFRKHHWHGLDAWLRFKRLYAGHHWGQHGITFHPGRITVNTAYAVVRNYIPSISMKDPRIFVEPAQSGVEANAAILESVLTKEWKARKVKQQNRLVLLDTAVFGWGVGKAGYRFNSEVAANALKDGEINYSILERADEPFIRRISIFNFLWDFHRAAQLDDSRWCAEMYFRPVDDVKADQRFENLDSVQGGSLMNLKTDLLSGIHERSIFNASVPDDDDQGHVALWDVYDKKFNRMWTIAEGANLPLRVVENPFPSMRGDFPYEVLRLDDIPDEPFPLSQIYLIEDQIHELDRIRTMQFSHRRKFTRKYQYLDGAVEPGELKKLQYGGDGTAIKVQQLPAISAIDDAPQSQDQILTEQTAKQDILEVTGGSTEISSAQAGKRSAASTRRAAAIQDNRIGDKRLIVGDYYSGIARKFAAIIQDTFTTPRAIQISGPALGRFWINFTSEQIQGQFFFDIDVSDIFPTDPAVNRKQWLDLYNLLKGDVDMNTIELKRRLFRAFDVKDMNSLFVQPLPEGTQFGAALQTALKSGNITPDVLNSLLGEQRQEQQRQLLLAQQSGQGQGNKPVDGTALQARPAEPVSIDGAPANLGSTDTGGS